MSANQLNHELKAVLATYSGFLKHQEFKSIAEESLAFIRQSGYHKILVDTSQTKVIQLQSQQWIDREWFPLAEQIGVTHMAFLIPKDFFGKMSVETTNKTAEQRGSISIEYFATQESARAWLQSKP
ncbi:MAG: hypothetical protein ACO1OQ_03670 [Rufibacter sp.]